MSKFSKYNGIHELTAYRNALTHISSVDDICGFYGMTQTALAQKMGITLTHLCDVKHFRSPAGAKFIMGLCTIAPDEVGFWLPNIIRLYCTHRGCKNGKVQ